MRARPPLARLLAALRRPLRLAGWLPLLWLAGCGTVKYTVDDGRPVNEELLARLRSYGQAEQVVRPAIARSAELRDPDCDKQWELPIAVATSYGWDDATDRVAWVRALGVDERVTVVGTAPGVALAPGDKIEAVAGYARRDSAKMLLELAQRRDAGEPFEVQLAGGRLVRLQPFQACRGYTRFAPVETPKLQDYHWSMSLHPLEVTQARLNGPEALWLVLWTQGVSEEGGARMKTFHYTKKIVGTLYDLATLVSGAKGVALAAEQAATVARNAATSALSEALKQQLIQQASAAASAKLRSELGDAAQRVTRQQAMAAMERSAANRGSLSGVAWVASTVFDRADAWAWERMKRLGEDPVAAFTLHQKLLELSLAENAMVLDPERLAALEGIARAQGRGEAVTAALQGLTAEELLLDLSDMPLASAPPRFSYEDAAARSPAGASAGLIEALLELPVESKDKP
jgi:hypothetical protein